MGILNKLMKEVPLDYQLGYSDGFDLRIKGRNQGIAGQGR